MEEEKIYEHNKIEEICKPGSCYISGKINQVASNYNSFFFPERQVPCHRNKKHLLLRTSASIVLDALCSLFTRV